MTNALACAIIIKVMTNITSSRSTLTIEELYCSLLGKSMREDMRQMTAEVFTKLKDLAQNKAEKPAAIIAEAFLGELNPFVYNEDFYIYVDGYYNPVNKKEALSVLHSVIDSDILDKISVRAQREAIDLSIAKAPRLDALPHYPNLLNVQNGIYDIENDRLIEHSPDYRMTYKLAVSYNPEAKADRFLECIEHQFGKHKKLKLNFQETMGYLISDLPALKEFTYFFGESNTGKSFYLALLRKITGESNINSVGLTQLNQEFYLASMINKKLNVCAEIGSKALNDLWLIKSLVGSDDAIQVRQIRQATKLVTEKPKMVFAGNHFPVLISDVENLDAFFNRIHIIPFDKVIPKEKQIEGLSDILYNNEAEGILLWMLDGYRHFLKNGMKFTASNRIRKIHNEYQRYYMIPFNFIKEQLVLSPSDKEFTEDVEKALKHFCKHHGYSYKPEYLENVRHYLVKHGVANKKVDKKIKKGKHKQKQGFYGVKIVGLKDEQQKEWNEI